MWDTGLCWPRSRKQTLVSVALQYIRFSIIPRNMAGKRSIHQIFTLPWLLLIHYYSGNYSCFAENYLGKSRGFIELSGKAVGKYFAKTTSCAYSMMFFMLFNNNFLLAWKSILCSTRFSSLHVKCFSCPKVQVLGHCLWEMYKI